MYTVNELAEKAGLVPAYVRQLILRGEIRGAIKIGGERRGIWQIPESVALAWLESRGVKVSSLPSSNTGA